MARKKKTQQKSLISVLFVLLGLAIAYLWYNRDQSTTVVAAPGDYLFCLWNVENLFDDENNPNDLLADKQYDDWMSQSKSDRDLKLKRHADLLLNLNGGKGPDILALVEVESPRAAELLKEALNARLPNTNDHYRFVSMKEVKSGRHIAPVIISRLPIAGNKTQQIGGKITRTLKTHINAAGKELVIITSHWRSRREQNGDDGSDRRAEYADDIYGAYKAMFLNNPKVDLIVCGDFNDDPSDRSVTQHLRATGNVQEVLESAGHASDSVSPVSFLGSWTGANPLLYNLMAGKDKNTYGSLYYRDWHIFDQMAVSPGMLDNVGWNCRPDSIQTLRKVKGPGGHIIDLTTETGRPWRFGKMREYGGNPAHRGYSDHFPVVLMLSVKGDENVAAR